MSTDPTRETAHESAHLSAHTDLRARLPEAPVLTSPHDFAAPELFPDDTEFEEFLAEVRAGRARDLA